MRGEVSRRSNESGSGSVAFGCQLWFQAAWAALFVMRMILFLFLAALSFGYWFMSSPILENTRKAYNLPGSSSLLGICVLAGFGVVVYASQLVQMVQFSIKRRRLAFRPRQPTVHSIALEAQRRKPASILRSVWLHRRVVYKEIFGSKGLMGIEHPYFLQLLMLREIAEILPQGYQAYASSTMVPRRWINNFATTLLVLNCWSTHLVQALGPKSLISQRVLCLAVDTVLDFGEQQLATELADGHSAALHHVVAGFHLDYASLRQHVGVKQVNRWNAGRKENAGPTGAITAAFEQARRTQADRSYHQAGIRRGFAINSATAIELKQIVELVRFTEILQPNSGKNADWHDVESVPVKQDATETRQPFSAVPHTGYLHHLCARMRPWFARSYACAYANINCLTDRAGSPKDHDAMSDETEITERLSAFHRSALRYLVVLHCSALKMPAIIHSFPNLQMVEVYNSTIVEWKATAAFIIDSHPFLRRFGLIRTNMSALPGALVQDAPFVFVNMIATNLTSLLDSIFSNWRALQYFNMEHGQLREFPRAIAAMGSLQRLSVCDNQIEALPKTLPGAYSVLNIARNPLHALPESVHDPSRLRIVSFEHTLVEEVPSWLSDTMAARASLSVYGTGSRFCDHQQQQQQTTSASSSPSSSPFSSSITGVECATPSRYVDGHYFLSLVSRFLASPSLA